MTRGSRAGTNFLLDPGRANRLGRDIDCDIVLTDPLCSRVHAIIDRDEEGWWLRDQKSRNGCFINGQKVDDGRLVVEGVTHTLRPGVVFVIPPHARHAGGSKTGCRVLDAFAPARDDYR